MKNKETLKKAVAVIGDYLNLEYNNKESDYIYYVNLDDKYIDIGYKSPCSDGYFWQFWGVCLYDINKNEWRLFLSASHDPKNTTLMNKLKKLTNL